jgi:dolichol-phosphate mannosyltransferase
MRLPGTSIRIITSYVTRRKLLIAKFLLVSGSAVVVNLLLLYLMVNNMGLNTRLGENLANVLSMEISIVYNFFLSRYITWKDRKRQYGWQLFIQICKFHIAIGITIALRTGLFALLQWFGIFYLLNAAIGIAISACFNFFAYDRFIFERGE